jgi:hypothetical protein
MAIRLLFYNLRKETFLKNNTFFRGQSKYIIQYPKLSVTIVALLSQYVRPPYCYYFLFIINMYDEAVASNDITFIPSFVKIGELFQTLNLEYT